MSRTDVVKQFRCDRNRSFEKQADIFRTNRPISPMLLKENGNVRRPLRSQNEFLIDGIEFLNKFFNPQPRLRNPLYAIGLERYYAIKPYVNYSRFIV